MGKITTVLFDLDGTLIGMDQDEFVKEYFSSIIEHLSSLGYDAPTAERALYGAVRAIFANDGKITNEQCFSRAFLDGIGGYTDTLDPLDDYYNGAFVEVISTTCYESPPFAQTRSCCVWVLSMCHNQNRSAAQPFTGLRRFFACTERKS